MPKGKMPPVPEVSDTLLTYLNYMYDNVLPLDDLIELPMFRRLQGQRDVVAHLEALRHKQSGLQPQ
jgi:hypothetical protein